MDILKLLGLKKVELEELLEGYLFKPDGEPKNRSAAKEDLTTFLNTEYPQIEVDKKFT